MSKTELFELINAKGLGSIPILNNGTMVCLEAIYCVAQKNKLNNPVFYRDVHIGTAATIFEQIAAGNKSITSAGSVVTKSLNNPAVGYSSRGTMNSID
ncbi:hypothetical protein N9395_06620 [Pseudomonadales bacterium]|nr:hypothetical protein [Pseudomonadales bacterium]